jgi:hypothetical protein
MNGGQLPPYTKFTYFTVMNFLLKIKCEDRKFGIENGKREVAKVCGRRKTNF